MYRVTRTAGGTAQIHIDQPQPGSPDAGLALGGSFYFEPGVPVTVNENVARAIMTDPDLAKAFTCEPALSSEPGPALPDPAPSPAPAPVEGEATPSAPRGRRAPQ
jgi:hypothetical protein